ncbi:MAG: aspartate aminotransferase family protein [Rhodothermales bacterium]|nr:aspartate aminotransferase family protein [Rhodothermales bacterium]
MPAEDFLRYGTAALEWLNSYYAHVESLPVVASVQPGDIRNLLPPTGPEIGEAFEKIMADMDRVILPGTTHWQSPNFYAYFPSNISGPSILAELLSAGMSVQGMLWKTGPACTEVETHVLDWLVYAMDLPKSFLSTESGGGVIQDTASSAVLCAVIAAREKATDGDSNSNGLMTPLVAYASSETHSSVEKAIRIAGIGSKNFRVVDVDKNFAMRPDHLQKMISDDRVAGRQPFFVCATVGTTSSNAVDPVRPIGEVCRRENVWFHVDAAMSGTVALCPEHRYLFDGLEYADSYNFNPHKWMMTNFDCSVLYVQRKSDLIESLSINPEYLHTKEYATGLAADYRDWQVPLGRRFRALKLWFVLRYYGTEGLKYHIRYHIALTRLIQHKVQEDPDFEVVVPAVLNMFCFRLRKGRSKTEALLAAINETGRAYMTHTIIGEDYVIRWCVGQAQTRMRHVLETWDIVQRLKQHIA